MPTIALQRSGSGAHATAAVVSELQRPGVGEAGANLVLFSRDAAQPRVLKCGVGGGEAQLGGSGQCAVDVPYHRAQLCHWSKGCCSSSTETLPTSMCPAS
jgi:hypothetical protein